MKKFIASIIVTLATVLTFNSNANASWTYFDYRGCHVDVHSWFLAELPENDTDDEIGPDDIDRVRTIGEDLTLYDRVDVSSDYNVISISIPTYFYGLLNQVSSTVMYVTIISPHETDWEQDYYYHSNAITVAGAFEQSDTKLYTIGAVIDNGGATQAPIPLGHREVTVEIEIVGPQGVQHHVDQVRVNTTATYSQAGGECPH